MRLTFYKEDNSKANIKKKLINVYKIYKKATLCPPFLYYRDIGNNTTIFQINAWLS